MLSPRSRGKGNRRVPGRDGGKQKRLQIAWRKQATHAVNDPSQLPGELVSIHFACKFGETASESIYRFDQRIAPLGVHYYAELYGTRRWPVFTIKVSANIAASVYAIVAKLNEG